MLAGDQSAEQICHQYTSSDSSLLPADRDSPIAPPAEEDHFAIGSVADVDHSHLSLYSAHVIDPNDWSQGATFTGDHNSQLIAVAPYNMLCINSCVPQEGTTDKLDSLADRLMYRFAYWEDPPSANVQATPPRPAPAQHWLVNHSVLGSQGNAAVRWYEFTAPSRPWHPPVSSYFSRALTPRTRNSAGWVSIARDKVGDILVGYSESGSRIPLDLRGRAPGHDPLGLGNLEAEIQVVAGTGAQLTPRTGGGTTAPCGLIPTTA